MLMATGVSEATGTSVKVVRTKADIVGIGLSGLCMVHCLVFPLLISFAPAVMRGLPGDDVTHRGLAIGIALASGLAFRSGFKVHRKGWILALFLLGIALISVAAALGDRILSESGETAITVCGSLLLITAHWCNRSFCHSCVTNSCHQGSSGSECIVRGESSLTLADEVVAGKMTTTARETG